MFMDEETVPNSEQTLCYLTENSRCPDSKECELYAEKLYLEMTCKLKNCKRPTSNGSFRKDEEERKFLEGAPKSSKGVFDNIKSFKRSSAEIGPIKNKIKWSKI